MKNDYTEIQVAVNEVLNVKSLVRRKKKSVVEKKRELFITIINSIEQVINRQSLMYFDLDLDLTKYDESFLEIIDALLLLHFGKECVELVDFYLRDRKTVTGEITPLVDTDGNEIFLNNPEELWNLIQLIKDVDG